MFCEKCGASLTPNDAFCRNCGAPTSAQPAAPVAPAAPEVPAAPAVSAAPAAPKRTGLIVGLSCGIAAFLVLIVVCIVLMSGGKGTHTVEGTVDKFISSIVKLDANGIADLIPEEMFAYAGTSRTRFINQMNDQLEDSRSYLDLMGAIDISHEITEQSSLGKSSFRDLQEVYAAYGLTISDAQKVRVRLELTSDIYGTDTENETLYLVQIDDNWYLDVVKSNIDFF